MDESAADIYRFSNNVLEYLPGSSSLSSIVARFNVTDIGGSGGTSWNTLELGYIDNSSLGSVSATLYEVDPCSNTPTAIATATSIDSSSPACVTATFAPVVTFQFHLYYVQTTMSRTSSGVIPRVLTLRVYDGG